ncbi:MAG: 50S ribosomal protein L17 [Candidatus Omnitrophota bacterium]
MRHRVLRYRLNRFTSFRKATLKSLARAVLLNQRIKTTKTKAKAAARLVEKLISLGKADTLSAKRRAFAILTDHKLVSLLFNDIAPRFKTKKGGYTRVILWKNRRGDNAQLAVLELTEIAIKEKSKPKPKEKAEKPTAPKPEVEAKEEAQKPERPKIVKPKPEKPKEEKHEEKKKETVAPPIKEEHKETKKPSKKFFGGLRTFFKKQKDST